MIGGDLVGAATLLAALLAVIGVGESWARIGDPDPEHSRKFVHLASAGACLLFPVLIESPVVVGAMAVGMGLFFAYAGRIELLESLHGVERTSRGSEYYAIAIFLVFLLAGDQPWIYVASVLILGLADASAALIGTRYGRFRYRVQNSSKSLEGSLAFFVITGLMVIATAALLSELPMANIVYIAVIAAVLLTSFEAISLDGADNLFVPVAGAVILQKLAEDSHHLLIAETLAVVAVFGAVFAINIAVQEATRAVEAPFDAGGIVAFGLFGYGTWALAGGPWTVPVAVGLVVALLAWVGSRWLTGVDLSMRIRPVYRALLIPFGVVLLANVFREWVVWFGPYLAVCSAVLAFAVTTLWRPNPEVRGPLYSTRFSAAVGLGAAAVVVGPVWLMYPDVGPVAPLVVVGATVVASMINYRIVERRPREPDDDYYWPASQLALAVVVGVVVLLAQDGGLVEVWEIPVDEELMRHDWEPWW